MWACVWCGFRTGHADSCVEHEDNQWVPPRTVKAEAPIKQKLDENRDRDSDAHGGEHEQQRGP